MHSAAELLRSRVPVKVWLTKKYADCIDGIDLSRCRVGDTLNLPASEAWLLLAEQWARPERRVQALPTTQKRRAADYRVGGDAPGHRDDPDATSKPSRPNPPGVS